MVVWGLGRDRFFFSFSVFFSSVVIVALPVINSLWYSLISNFSQGVTSSEVWVLCSNYKILGVPPLNCSELSPLAIYQWSEERPLLSSRTSKDGTVNAINFLPTVFAALQGSAALVAACFLLICRRQHSASISEWDPPKHPEPFRESEIKSSVEMHTNRA